MRTLATLLLIAAAAVAADAPAPVMTQAQLEKLTTRWQKKLLLQDWRVDVLFMPLETFQKGVVGTELPDPQLREAVLSILAPGEYKKIHPKWTVKQVLNDIEFTVVHELYHVRMFDLTHATDKQLPDAEEMTVDRLTQITLGRQ